jgi:importin-4
VSAIVLRKRIVSHYAKYDDATKATLKSEILRVLANEPERSVRGGVVGIAAALAKVEEQSWADLWQFVAAASTDPHPDARELAFWILSETTDTIGVHLTTQFSHLSALYSAGLQDSESKVQKASVKALGQLMSFLSNEPDVDIFSGLLPGVLTVAAQCVQAHDDETVTTVLDVLYDLAYSPSASVTAQLNDIVRFSLLCMANTQLEMGVRDSAALVIATLAEAKPKTLGKEEQLVSEILDTLFMLIENSPESAAGALLESNPAWKEDMNLEDNSDEPTETSMAQGTLDMMACELPKKFIFQPVMSRCISRLASPKAAARKSGIAGLGVIAEGCSEQIREHLHDVMPHVFAAAGDAEAQVRECACFALGQISEHCQPEILGYSAQILPIVFALLDDTTVSVQATSCYVLEMFCERLEPDAVRPLLDPLVRKLAAMLESTNKRSVQEMAVAALAATAVAAEEEFTPYVGGVAALMTKLMALQEEKLYSLRGRALECMGHMAVAVGKQTFRPYFTGTMQCACDGLATDSTDLHEFAYAVFANLSKVMGEEFAPVLPDLVPHLVKVISANEGQLEKAEEEAVSVVNL